MCRQAVAAAGKRELPALQRMRHIHEGSQVGGGASRAAPIRDHALPEHLCATHVVCRCRPALAHPVQVLQSSSTGVAGCNTTAAALLQAALNGAQMLLFQTRKRPEGRLWVRQGVHSLPSGRLRVPNRNIRRRLRGGFKKMMLW